MAAFQPAPLAFRNAFELQGPQIRGQLDELTDVFWPHQRQAATSVYEELRNRHQRISLAVLPTGAGKTALAILLGYILTPRHLLILTPSQVISEQMFSEFGCTQTPGFLERRGMLAAAARHDDMLPQGELISQARQLLNLRQFRDLTVANAHKFGAARDDAIVDIQDINRDAFDLVIVDEAHHYPAKTWRDVVDHFQGSQIVFLTATPYHRGTFILDQNPAFTLTTQDAEASGIIRRKGFFEVGLPEDDEVLKISNVVNEVRRHLRHHDEQVEILHQGLIITRTVEEAAQIVAEYTRIGGEGTCAQYVTNTDPQVKTDFINRRIQTLVIIGRLLEGFDQPSISVVGIVRNINAKSRVLFAQVVGRALRRTGEIDPVEAAIISHVSCQQQQNFNNLDNVVDD